MSYFRNYPKYIQYITQVKANIYTFYKVRSYCFSAADIVDGLIIRG